MNSTTTLRSDTARTGTNPNFPINSNPWRKYVSIDLTNVVTPSQPRPVRAGVLVVQDWLFNAGPRKNETHTLALVATTTNELFCFGEGDLLQNGSAAKPLWYTSLAAQGFAPRTRTGSNMAAPIGIAGTPVVDTANRRMFVVAMWEAMAGAAHGSYSIFNISLDTGKVTDNKQLVDTGTGRVTFTASMADSVDQRTAINLAGGWLWFGFAAYLRYDAGPYNGWVVAVNPGDLTKQLYQPMVSLASSQDSRVDAMGNKILAANMTGAGVWGVGGVAAADDGTVFALTGNGVGLGPEKNPYWDWLSQHPVSSTQAAGPGNIGDFFQAAVHLGVNLSGADPQLAVTDWYQEPTVIAAENFYDWDFGGSSPLVLPTINGRQLLVFVPKDGNIYILDTQNMGNFSPALALINYANAYNKGGNDTKTALAFVQTPDGRNILVAGADSNGTLGGLSAFQIDAVANPPTLTKLWTSPKPLGDSFGSPTIIANPVTGSTPPSPFALAWVITGTQGLIGSFVSQCTMRAYDVLTGSIVYDSDISKEVTEVIPCFTAITSGGNSVFSPTNTGFMGFTQFTSTPKTISFIMDRTTFGMDEVDALEKTSPTADFGSAYWVSVGGFLPSELGLTPANLSSPPTSSLPTITATLDPTLPVAVAKAINSMLTAATFDKPVIPDNSSLPDEPQGFLFPFTVSFTGNSGFTEMVSNKITSTLVTLTASFGSGLSTSAQIELVTGEDPFFIDVNPSNKKQPTWLSFDLRLFKVTENQSMFGDVMSSNEADAPTYITNVISNLNKFNGVVGSDSFTNLVQTEGRSALEFNPKDNYGRKVFNFALARVSLNGNAGNVTPTPVRVFFRLFQAQNTVSNFNTTTTYRFAANAVTGSPDHKIALLGVKPNQSGVDEYVTIPCFATARNNLHGPVNMGLQKDPANARTLTVTPGVDHYFGCWLDVNQPQQLFLPAAPPAGNWDGPWTAQWATPTKLQSVRDSILHAPHQCLIAEIRYDDAPTVPNATSATSDKLAQRNIAWLDGPGTPTQQKVALIRAVNSSVDAPVQVAHPIQITPSGYDSRVQDELMITWDTKIPSGSQAQLYLPALSAATITTSANSLYPAQRLFQVDEHTIGFDASGVTFVPIPPGTALAAGLLTIDLSASNTRGAQYTITIRQLTEAVSEIETTPPPPPIPKLPPPPQIQVPQVKADEAAVTVISWRRVAGAFQFVINITAADDPGLLLTSSRLLATFRYQILQLSTQNRWYPILQRYIDYLIGRVVSLGGNPGTILPSPVGAVPGWPGEGSGDNPGNGGEKEEWKGKIEAIIFSGVGKFRGFVIRTKEGSEHKVRSDEEKVKDVVERAKAKCEAVLVVVRKADHTLVELVVF